MILFVYGTLRRGEQSHHLIGNAPLVAEACTGARYTLVDMGGYPAMLIGGNTEVTGELYRIDLHTLATLDLFEEVPERYRRQTITFGDATAAFYVLPREYACGAPPIESGDWCTWDGRP